MRQFFRSQLAFENIKLFNVISAIYRVLPDMTEYDRIITLTVKVHLLILLMVYILDNVQKN